MKQSLPSPRYFYEFFLFFEVPLREIERANVVIVLWTSNSSQSMGQLIEVGAAWALKKRIITVTYEMSPSKLPAMVLRGTQSIAYGQLTEINFVEHIRHWFPDLD